MADEIKWNMIGREELIGREAVINHCNKSAKFLETVSTTLTKPKIYHTETCVVLEGAAQFKPWLHFVKSSTHCPYQNNLKD
jgi:hypothetical protein